jgi:pimeloyl-ACP methyl ester carboxylesterase
MSPVVSYQFYDSQTDMGTNSPIVSPVASYQYFDWPGTADLQAVNSPSVSFFYETAGLSSSAQTVWGVVTDFKGGPVANVTVTASILSTSAATTQTALDGSYSLPALAPGIYEISASLSGFVADQRVISLSTATARENFLLNPLPAPPQITTAGSTPPFAQVPGDIQGADLVVFNGAVFQAGLPLDPTKMTVVLTHGWVPPGSSGFPQWPKDMALAMKAKGVWPLANIVAWDWHVAAYSSLTEPIPWNKTYDQGTNLGWSLYQILGADYSQPVHFIGHSLGTMVNAEAANFLTGNPAGGEAVAPNHWNPKNIHLTLLDEAQIALKLGTSWPSASWAAALGIAQGFSGGPTASEIGPAYSPIPMQPQTYKMIENYISAFGLIRNDALNVYLPEAADYFVANDLLGSAVGMHGYPMTWYETTVANPTDSQMGFINSFEATNLSLETAFPPAEQVYMPGNGFEQTQIAGNALDLADVSSPLPTNWNAPFLPLAFPSGTSGLSQRVSIVFTNLWEVAGESTAGAVSASIVQTATVATDDAFNFLSSQFSQAIVDLDNQPQLLLALTTAAAPLQAKPQTPPPGGGSGAFNTPACVWMTLSVPANASELTFNFTASGNCAQDSLVFGVNSNSLFCITLAYLTAGQAYSSGPIDISAYADSSTNQFFFGVLGGTSTNATVQVEDIQFVSFTLPSLSIAQANGTAILSWPSSANGYILQSTADLSVESWEDVTNVPSLFGGVFTVTNSWSDQTRFFRLNSQ